MAASPQLNSQRQVRFIRGSRCAIRLLFILDPAGCQLDEKVSAAGIAPEPAKSPPTDIRERVPVSQRHMLKAAPLDQSPESPAYLDELRAALRRETGDRRKRRHDA